MKIIKTNLDSPEYIGYKCTTSKSFPATQLHDYDMPIVNGLNHILGMGSYSSGENYEFQTPFLQIVTSIHRKNGVSNIEAQCILDAENFIRDLIGDFGEEIFVVQDYKGNDFINANSIISTYIFGNIALAVNAFCRTYNSYNVAKKYLSSAHANAEHIGMKKSRLMSLEDLNKVPAPALEGLS
ncbi:MAG: hypothetical protein ACT4OY_02320 [Alphaproteobacteria bacterium]